MSEQEPPPPFVPPLTPPLFPSFAPLFPQRFFGGFPSDLLISITKIHACYLSFIPTCLPSISSHSPLVPDPRTSNFGPGWVWVGSRTTQRTGHMLTPHFAAGNSMWSFWVRVRLLLLLSIGTPFPPYLPPQRDSERFSPAKTFHRHISHAGAAAFADVFFLGAQKVASGRAA